MKKTLIEIGCDGGSLKLQSAVIYGIFLFKIQSFEFSDTVVSNPLTYINIQDAWQSFKLIYPQWHQLYLITIESQMIDLLKMDYLAVEDKNEYTQDRWLVHLTGKGLGF
jgi:hypothetical protein